MWPGEPPQASRRQDLGCWVLSCGMPTLELVHRRGGCRASQPGLAARAARMPGPEPCSARPRTLLRPVVYATSRECDPPPLRRGCFVFPYTAYHCSESLLVFSLPHEDGSFLGLFVLKILLISVVPGTVTSDCSVNIFG